VNRQYTIVRSDGICWPIVDPHPPRPHVYIYMHIHIYGRRLYFYSAEFFCGGYDMMILVDRLDFVDGARRHAAYARP
jgi:hypothetical protein